MLTQTEGLVLKQIPFSDSSIIVKIFTREYGLLSFLVKAAKSSKSSKASILRPMNEVFISFYNRENKGLKQIKECTLLFAPDSLQFGIYKSAVTMFMIELISSTVTIEALTDIEKYDFLKHSYQFLKENSLNSNFYLSLFYQYSQYLGISIPIEIFESVGIEKNLSDYSCIGNSIINKIQRKRLFEAMEQHYFENLTNYKSLKSIRILEEIL